MKGRGDCYDDEILRLRYASSEGDLGGMAALEEITCPGPNRGVWIPDPVFKGGMALCGNGGMRRWGMGPRIREDTGGVS